MLPRSGKFGYFIKYNLEDSTISVLPIGSWELNVTKNRTMYRTAKSFPNFVRSGMPVSETLSIYGFNYSPAFSTEGLVEGRIGWFDLVTNKLHSIGVKARLQKFQYVLDYRVGQQSPPFSWTADFVDFTENDSNAEYDKYFFEEDDSAESLIEKFKQECFVRQCDKTIETDDVLYHDLILHHVKRAVLTFQREMLDFIDTKSYPRFANGDGTRDWTAELEIEGDFNYWYDKINYEGTMRKSNLYRFHFGPDPLIVIEPPKMHVLGLSNLLTNIETAEIVSATVSLGAAQ